MPAGIAALLGSHPAVRECAVRLMRPEEGERLKAFIVPRDEAILDAPAALGRELRVWLAKRLSPPETPKSLLFGPELPRTVSGKLADWSIFPDSFFDLRPRR